jgi:hypothetical protein
MRLASLQEEVRETPHPLIPLRCWSRPPPGTAGQAALSPKPKQTISGQARLYLNKKITKGTHKREYRSKGLGHKMNIPLEAY